METAIFHIGNAGLFFYRNGTGILIDGIYDGSKVGMSAMPELTAKAVAMSVPELASMRDAPPKVPTPRMVSCMEPPM